MQAQREVQNCLFTAADSQCFCDLVKSVCWEWDSFVFLLPLCELACLYMCLDGGRELEEEVNEQVAAGTANFSSRFFRECVLVLTLLCSSFFILSFGGRLVR